MGSTSRLRASLLFLLSLFVLTSMLFSLLISLSPCAWEWRGGQCYRGYESDYSFDVETASHAAWMKAIPDSTNLTSLSIPGTHDTLTFDVRDQLFQCQNQNLSAQLRAGVRYLDVRGRLNNDSMLIYHGGMYTGYSYTDVLLTLFEFLEENPSETILMRLKEEGRPIGANTRTFEEAFNYYLWNSSTTAKGSQEHFYMPASFTPYPTLGELRGKIFLLQNFPSKQGGPYGVIWDSTDMVVEDLWIIPSVDYLWMKWDAIEAALKRAATDPDDNLALYLSHISASVGVLPIEAAAGSQNGSVVGMNDRTGEWLEHQVRKGDPFHGRAGVVIIDFPGRRFVDAVLERNAGLIDGDAELR